MTGSISTDELIERLEGGEVFKLYTVKPTPWLDRIEYRIIFMDDGVECKITEKLYDYISDVF
ncbi:hypothetical protein [Priestia megaterium]|uniref:hypothetical protein n=1 Tax=Priestia megaterium TaxID=1404 RepID=UPI002877A792|nr:hypothetical protein [Priestia megaterium]